MSIRIALAGNPNCGKTTLFNALTGSNQYVGNWPGVTVEKKEGKLKKHEGVIITDLPGIYSLSPYTLEEVVARNYLIDEHPDAILNIVDGTNLERNLYLTTQLIEIGIPVVIAINMMDIVRKKGESIDIEELSKIVGCKVVEISALKNDNVFEAIELAIDAAENSKNSIPIHKFSSSVERAIATIEQACLSDKPENKKRWYAVKLFERDEKIVAAINLDNAISERIEKEIKACEEEFDDDAESIIINERYNYITSSLKSCYKKKKQEKLSISDKIDKVVTNRWAALPIFAAIMFLVYYISVTTIGTFLTDWANDGVFGDGWHFFGIGEGKYEQAMSDYAAENLWSDDYILQVKKGVEQGVVGADETLQAIEDGDFAAFDEAYGFYQEGYEEKGIDIATKYDEVMGAESVPNPADYGVYIPGVPAVVGGFLTSVNCAPWLESLILDGIIGGVGAVLGFVPQVLVLFLFLAFLEDCGYMARIAFVMDKLFRKIGLSGKSLIPILIGTGCGVPGIMASRTIESDKDRKITIMTTTFIPCSAKLPIISLITVALFGGEWWVAPSAYFLGIAAIVISGIILKKTKILQGESSPFVMELPAYHMPTAGNIFRSMWERGWSFIKKAGTIIFLASVFIWLFSRVGNVDGHFGFSVDLELSKSILGYIGNGLKWIFAPLGFNSSEATVATIMGLVAKEEVVGVFGVLDFMIMSKVAGYSFLAFNLLCAPCFAAIGAIRREMNNGKWTAFAIGYQCAFAYTVSLIIYQLGMLFTGHGNVIGSIVAFALLLGLGYLIFRPMKKNNKAV